MVAWAYVCVIITIMLATYPALEKYIDKATNEYKGR